MGGLLGGIIGNISTAGERGQAESAAAQANQLIQNLANAPDQAKPLLLQQYRQQGLLTPQMEAMISAGPSAMAGVKTGGEGAQAQQAALQQMLQRAQGGMTAQDRAALAQAQQQAATEQNAKQQQILQQFAQRGQAGSGAQLAAQLAASQGGANQLSQAGLDIMGRSQQQALQAASQAGGLGAQLESQQFGEASQKAQAADQMQRFNIQNQMAAQQANTMAQNQAQAQNLALQQQTANQNVGMANQEAARQRAGEQQNFMNQMGLAQTKANALGGYGNFLNQQAQQQAQGWSNIGSGIDTTGVGLAKAGVLFNQGGQVYDYRNGGHVPGKEVVPGDHPANDTVDAKLSPGEIVVNKELAQSSLGDKLLDLINLHHEVKSHLDKHDEKNKKKMSKGGKMYADGGEVDAYPPGTPDTVKSNFSPEEAWSHYKARQAAANTPAPAPTPAANPNDLAQTATNFFNTMARKPASNYDEGGEVKDDDKDKSEFDKAGQTIASNVDKDKLKQFHPFSNGGQVPQKGSRQYLEYLMGQYKQSVPKKGYADGGDVTPDDEIDTAEQAQEPQNEDEIAPTVEKQMPTRADLEEEALADAKKTDEAQAGDRDLEEEIKKKDEMEKPEEDDSIAKEIESEAEASGVRKPADDESKDEEPSDEETPSPTPDTSAGSLKEAQKRRRLLEGLNDIAQGGALMGSGIARTDPSKALQVLQKQAETLNLPVNEYKEQVANQQNDPNSSMSQVARQYMQTKGFKVPDTAAYSDLIKIAPFLQKDQSLQVQIQKALMGDLSKREQIKAYRERTAAMGQQKQEAQKAKDTARQADAAVKLENDMNSSRAKRAVALAQQNKVYAENALRMVQEFPDLNKWTPSQVTLFNSEIGKIAQGGVPSQVELNELKNPTAAMAWSKLVSSVKNVPQGAKQAEFIKLNQKYLKGLLEGAQGILKDNIGNTLKSYQGKLSPEAYKKAVYRHSHDLGLYTPQEEQGIANVMSKSGLSREDSIAKLIELGKLKDANY